MSRFLSMTIGFTVALGLCVLLPRDSARGGIWDPCQSTATIAPGPFCLLADVVGGGDQLSDPGAEITVFARDNTGAGIPDIPATDFWVIGCNDGLILCGGSGAIDADRFTDGDGRTTISNAPRVGGCDSGLHVVVQGIIIMDPGDCHVPLCLPVIVRTTDLNNDLASGLQDFALFGQQYPTVANPSPPFNPCLDYDCSGGPLLGLVDFSLFAQHYDNRC